MISIILTVGTRQAGLNISEASDLHGFLYFFRVSLSNTTVGGNVLVMRKVRGDWSDWFRLTGILQ